MKARLIAVQLVLILMVPTASVAEDNPFRMFKEMFREPAQELKQQFRQLTTPGKPATTAKPKASEANAATPNPTAKPAAPTAEAAVTVPKVAAEPETAAVPIPVANPVPKIVKRQPADGSDEADVEAAEAAPSVAAKPKTAAVPKPVAEPAPEVVAGPAPVIATLPPPDSAEEEVDEFETALAPIPRPRPAIGIPYAAVEPALPGAKSVAAIGSLVGPLPSLVRPPPAARSTCGVALAQLGVEAKPIAPISEGVCGVPEPVAVAALGGGMTDLTTKAIIGCQLAEAFAGWLDDDVQPAARKYLGGDVVGLRVAASYVCRPRNNVEGAKLSEHGRGNAIDISAIKVAGRDWIEVGGAHSSKETRFLATIRSAACGPFTTVLGPGTDANHSDHFHFDRAKRSKRGKSRGLYCK